MTGFLIFSFACSFAKKDSAAVEPVEPNISFNVLYTSNDTAVLTATIFIRKGREFINLQNAPISFSASDGKNNIRNLGEVFSDSMGNAIFSVSLTPALPFNEEGLSG